MSTPSSSSSIPYRYPSAQPQDPRVSVQRPYQHHQPAASTSTASAYAYVQQQQQQVVNRTPQSLTSSGASSYAPYVPSPLHRQSSSQPRRPSPLADRPHSIEELAKIAGQDRYDRYGDIKQDLRYAEVYLSEGRKDLEAGDLEWAFVHFARTATLVLQKMPTNSHYNEMKEAHRTTLADNGNFCLERMSEIKPKLVDRYELWRQRNPNIKPELDMARMLSAMAVRDNEELALRAQVSKERRAASKEEAARRARAEENAERRRQEEAMRREQQRLEHEEEARRKQEIARQQPVYDAAARQAYEDARRKQDEARRRETEERNRVVTDAELDRQRREAEEEGMRREEEIARRKYEEAQRLEHSQRQERETASRRKIEELEYRRQRDEARRRELDETRRREQEGIAQRQRQAEAEAEASRSMLHVTMPVPEPPSSSASSSSDSSISTQTLTPRQQEELPILPLESPTREESVDPRSRRHHPQPHYAMPDRAIGRTNTFHSPITTTSPPPKDIPGPMNFMAMSVAMTDHQRAQGYTPSLQSMFSTPITEPPTGALLFSPNHPEGPSMKNMPSSPDRPPAHIRHMWEQAGYGYKHQQPSKPKPSPHGDSRILRPDQVRDRDDAATVFRTELKIVKVPHDVLPRFLDVAAVNTARNKETCGLLMGREVGNEYKVVTLLIPKQRATSDTCTMEEEELVSEFVEKRKMITLGWIHTHPTQSCFMSSLDLHTHAGFQCSLAEFFAIVCAPSRIPNCGIFRLTDPPGLKTILHCTNKASFHPHKEVPIYTDADKGHVSWVDDATLEIVDLR